jgi:hypothetical protein
VPSIRQQGGQFSYAFFVHNRAKEVPDGRWTNGRSLDGKGQYSAMIPEPLGGEPTPSRRGRTAARRPSRAA